MLTIDEMKRAVAKIGKKYNIKSAYLFGSYAKNTATESSDVDLIIDKGDIHTFSQYFNFHEELERELDNPVDLLTEQGTSPKFHNLIKNNRIFLYGA